MYRKYLFAFVAVILLTACGGPPKEYIAQPAESSFVEKTKSEPARIGVYVCGAVASPGVVELPEGARIADAIAAAGGLLANADTRLLNQARRLTDGEQITVLTENEAEALLGEDPAQRTRRLLGQESVSEADGKINLNSADEKALMTLPGIGEAKAKAITEYRKANGAFSAIEDVCNVPGIKGSVFEKIKDRITV